MPCRFLVVCEAEADFRMVTRLVERVIREHVDWIDDDLLRGCPIWFDLDQNTPFLKWSEIKNVASREGTPAVRGAFDGRGGEYDAPNVKRVFRLFERWRYQGRDIHGILLVRDHDGAAERFDWLIKARDSEAEISKLVVIGIARHDRECWVLAGYTPSNKQEEKLITDFRTELGFDPCVDSHRLTARADHEPRSAKRVLGRLTRNNEEREEACWTQTPLSTLRERGEASGLRAFLREIEERLVPLFTDHPSPNNRQES